MKQYQRDVLLDLGVENMFWTFDPLESRNAYLNLNVLGARVDSYVPHFYGETPVAATDTVIGTDRFVVCWELAEKPSTFEQEILPDSARISIGPNSEFTDNALDPTANPRASIHLEIPADIQSLKSEAPELAAKWRQVTREVFVRYIEAGYCVAQFRVAQGGQGGCYVLQPPPVEPDIEE